MTSSKKQFEKFYSEHFDKVYRFVFFRTGNNKEQAEDLVSEIFLKILEHFAQYDETKSKSAWAMTIAKNHLSNYFRDLKKTEALPDETEEEANIDAVWLKAALKEGQKGVQNRELADLLLKLEENDREIVTFHYLFGYSYSEIAEMKNASEGAIKVAAHRSLKKLRMLVE